MRAFVVELGGLKTKNIIKNKQLSLNENKNNFDEKLNDNNNKRTVKKLHDACWKNIYFTSANVAILGHRCSVSQYPQFYDQQLEKCQLLPRPYLGILEGGNGEK